MEMATNVRDFLVGMEGTAEPDTEVLLNNLQELHEQYLLIMNEFSEQVSDLALSMSPEARIVAHELRVRMYQDWRARLMGRIFNTESTSTPPASPSGEPHNCEGEVCVCTQNRRLEMYKTVIADFLRASPTIKSNSGSASPGCGEKRAYEPTDSGEFSDDGLADQCFMFPEFLRKMQLA